MHPIVQNSLALRPLVQTPPNERWRTEAMRSHASPRLFHIARGQGRITIAGLTSGYGANNLIFVPAGTMYGYEANSSVFGHTLTIPTAMAGEWPDAVVHLRVRDVVAQKELAGLFDALERELNSERSGHSRASHYHLGLLAVCFERLFEARQPDPNEARQDSSAARIVAAYTDLIERDYRSSKGVADYARALGVTPTHLTRCCNETCGTSALQLLNDRILFEARRLLRDTKTPIQDIAQQLGYTSAAYFARSFGQRTGQSPSRFRKETAQRAGQQ